MFWPPQNVTFFHSKLLLDNSASFTSSEIKDLCQKWKVKIIFWGIWNRLMARPDWPWSLSPFYDISTPLLIKTSTTNSITAGHPTPSPAADRRKWSECWLMVMVSVWVGSCRFFSSRSWLTVYTRWQPLVTAVFPDAELESLKSLYKNDAELQK